MEGLIKKRRPRPAGRPKGARNKKSIALLELADQLGLKSDPLRYLLAIVACDGCIQVPRIDPATGKPAIGADGKPMLEWIAITTRQKLDACKELMPYIRPKLAATSVSGKDGGPIEAAVLDISQILADPVLAKQAQELALRVIEQAADTDNDAATLAVRKREG